MRSVNRIVIGLCLIALTLAGLFGSETMAAGPLGEVEPNNDCLTAQDLGALNGSLTISGSLAGLSSPYPDPGETPNVDVFRIGITNTSLWKITVAGAASGGGTLERPLVVIYGNSGTPYCNVYQTYTPSSATGAQDVVIYWRAVAISEISIGVSSCCDGQLPLGGSAGGSYTLTIEETEPVGPITGRILDAATGQPIIGDFMQQVGASLYRCAPDRCVLVRSTGPDAEGYFTFDDSFSAYYSEPLTEGDYLVVVRASGYRPQVSTRLTLAPGEGRDLGTFNMTVSQLLSSLSGRLVNSRTGAPVPFARVRLDDCTAYECYEIDTLHADESGQFFRSSDIYTPLFDGIYRIRVESRAYYEYVSEPFELSQLDTDIGTIALTPLPQIGAISGRLVDVVTGAPLSGAVSPFSFTLLLRCSDTGCSDAVSSVSPDAEGAFQYIASENGYLPPGRYQIQAFADQYLTATTEPFTVAEDEDYRLGSIRLQSIPLRMQGAYGCDNIPAAGGVCRYGVKIINGLAERSAYQVWSTVSTFGPGTNLRTNTFQPEATRRVVLQRSRAVDLRYQVNVPAGVPAGTTVCATIYAAPDQRGFYFYSVNQRFIFCSVKLYDGSFRMLPEAEARDRFLRMQGVPPSQRGRR